MIVDTLKNKRTLVIALTAVTLLAIVLWMILGSGNGDAATKNQPQAFSIPVEVAKVKTDTVVETVEAVGTLRANEAVIIRPELDGRVAQILFEEGQRVQQGDVLVALETSIVQAELDQARAALSLSETNYRRAKKLMQQGAGSVSERDNALSQLKVNRAAVALAEARLNKMAIKAPFNGTLGLRKVSVGDYLTPGQDIVNLVAIDPIKVDFRVSEVYLMEVAEGQAIELNVDALPEEKIVGEVYAIDPQVDVNGRSIVIRALIPNTDRRLRPGLFARVKLIVNRYENAQLVPEEALVPRGDKQFVFRVVDGKAVLTEVELGLRQGTNVVIKQGLVADATVVTGGQMKIHDGTPVSPVTPAGVTDPKQKPPQQKLGS